jgi:hypothetical protein
LERLGNHVDERPTVLVWAKVDHLPAEGIRGSIRRTLKEQVPHGVEAEASTEQPDSLSSALEAVLGPAWMPPRAHPIVEPVLRHHPFGAFRGIHARS